MSSQEYTRKNIEAIISDHSENKFKGLALAASWVIANQKGFNLKVFDVSESSSLADYYILASTQNIIQSKSILDSLSKNLKAYVDVEIKVEGIDTGDWILIDLGDMIIHLFQDSSREIFDLDALWAESPQLKIPQDYYFAPTNSESEKEDTKGYF